MNEYNVDISKLLGDYKPIIKSLLDTDLYKFSMGQVIYHQYSDYKTTWAFKCRNKDIRFTDQMVAEIMWQIKEYCKLTFIEEELEYLDSIKWIKGNYIDFLRLWHPRFEDFTIGVNDNKELIIRTKGTWLNTSMYEIPVLAIVNEVYFKYAYNYEELKEQAYKKLRKKILWFNDDCTKPFNFSEFGTRRRLSFETQDEIIKSLSESIQGNHFVGTSNVYFAKKYNLIPVGTMAHEFAMCVGQGNFKHNPAYSNYYMMNSWVKEYGVLNGTALTDTIKTDTFLKDFDLTFATLFSGVRHDSGDPIKWGEKIIDHYNKLGIDPKTKTLLFSDSLDFEKAEQIMWKFHDKVRVAFGIGTYLTNDTNEKPLNIVMKVVKCNGTDVAKISDTFGKGMCENPKYEEYLARTINWRLMNEK